MNRSDFDLCVIGGGINGAGIARDAAGRGLSVVLIEQGDLAQGTSSASTKLIHGGLRYLEYCDFKLVRESLKERETLLQMAPHVIWPLEFVLPQRPGGRPDWMVRAGLFLYDNLVRRSVLPASRSLALGQHRYGEALAMDIQRGYSYADCWADDSRLVVLNAMDAHWRGAVIRTRTRCVSLRAQDGVWDVGTHGPDGSGLLRARAVINAAGPWARSLLEQAGQSRPDMPRLRLVKGSHIIVPRQYAGDQCYILQQPDRRIVFAIPYERSYTLIGTTEEPMKGDPGAAQISEKEIEYLCAAYNSYFQKPISREDVIWTYSGVRPLFDDGQEKASAVSRDHAFFTQIEAGAPMLSVLGGKLTTFRVVAEQAVNGIVRLLARDEPGWTSGRPLPGGDLAGASFDEFWRRLQAEYEWIPRPMLHRMARSYGMLVHKMIEEAKSLQDLGAHFGADFYDAELRYMVRHEWVRSAEDALWRRSKLGLHLEPRAIKAVEERLPELLKEEGVRV